MSIDGNNNRIENCIMHDANYAAVNHGVVSVKGNNHTVTRSTLYNSGRFIIQHYNTSASQFTYNRLSHASRLTADGGITYTWDNDGKGTVIAYNWVHDIKSTGRNSYSWGIYLDDRSSNHIIHNNVIWNFDRGGIMVKNSNEVYNNTVVSGHLIWFQGTPAGTVFKNNLVGKGLAHHGSLDGIIASNNGEFEIDERFLPVSGSGAIDGGTVIPPYTDGFMGSAPDMGAYEVGGEYWTPGATIEMFDWSTYTAGPYTAVPYTDSSNTDSSNTDSSYTDSPTVSLLISDKPIKSKQNPLVPTVLSLNSAGIALFVPITGSYSVTLFDLTGRIVLTKSSYFEKQHSVFLPFEKEPHLPYLVVVRISYNKKNVYQHIHNLSR
jgi:hypothetical protein